MRAGRLICIALILIVLAQAVAASGLSVALKRTNPGIVGAKSAELIFDVVNTNMDYNVQGFILCRSPDDVSISSSLGVGSGSGAQYISPLFTMDKAPSQKAIYLTVDSTIPGDYNSNCIIKYVFFREINGKKTYLKMNLEETDILKDSSYSEIRLDKNIPFVQVDDYANVFCPGDETSCTTSNVVITRDSASSVFYKYATILLIIMAVFLCAYILMRSRK